MNISLFLSFFSPLSLSISPSVFENLKYIKETVWLKRFFVHYGSNWLYFVFYLQIAIINDILFVSTSLYISFCPAHNN